jgi:hypothetical protein
MSSYVWGLPTSRTKDQRLRRSLFWELVGSTAGAAGTAIRWVMRGLSYTPGLAAPLLVCAGLWMIYEPLAFLAGGLILFALDRRLGRAIP